MIARTWRGATRARDSEAYLDYLHQTGFAEYRKIPGNRGVLGLRRIVNDRAEFLLVSLWDSEDAIRQFAGDDIE
jgi:heme-degrading monooxygenase HmoA